MTPSGLTPSSAFVLAFAWRRVRAERVGLLFARRPGGGSPLRLDGDERVALHPLAPLSLGALHSMLHARLGVTLSRPRLRRVHEVSGGNPFFALELARSYPEGRGGADLPPMSARLREVVSERLAALPQPTRSALAAVAALSRPTLSLVVTAAGGEEPLRPAFEAGVLEVEGERVRFSHPLLASGAYEAADPLERRHLHRRLAGLVDDDAERWRHEALAATGPDAAVAAGLDRAAAAQRARGAAAAAADLCEQARRLAPPHDAAGARRRRLSEAHYRWAAGDAGGASALLERAVACAPSSRERAEAMAGLARVLTVEGDQRRAVELAALALAEPDADDAVRIDAALGLASGQALPARGSRAGRPLRGPRGGVGGAQRRPHPAGQLAQWPGRAGGGARALDGGGDVRGGAGGGRGPRSHPGHQVARVRPLALPYLDGSLRRGGRPAEAIPRGRHRGG